MDKYLTSYIGGLRKITGGMRGGATTYPPGSNSDAILNHYFTSLPGNPSVDNSDGNNLNPATKEEFRMEQVAIVTDMLNKGDDKVNLMKAAHAAATLVVGGGPLAALVGAPAGAGTGTGTGAPAPRPVAPGPVAGTVAPGPVAPGPVATNPDTNLLSKLIDNMSTLNENDFLNITNIKDIITAIIQHLKTTFPVISSWKLNRAKLFARLGATNITNSTAKLNRAKLFSNIGGLVF